MKKIMIVLLILVLAAVTLSATARVIYRKGTVYAKLYKGAGWTRVSRATTLRSGAVISTGYRSAVVLRVYNKNWTSSIVRVYQFTTMSVAALAYNQKKRTMRTKLTLKIGRVRAVVRSNNKLKLRSRFTISTPVATASVRGTSPEVSHFPGFGTSVRYFSGKGDVFSKLRKRRQLLSRGQNSRVGGNGGSTNPFQEDNAGRKGTSMRFHLSPAERAFLFNGFKNRLGATGQRVRGLLDRFKTGIKIRNLVIEPRML